MKKFKIDVKINCEIENLDHEDREYWVNKLYTEFYYMAKTEDQALDLFHSTEPISCLDDFDISCEVVE